MAARFSIFSLIALFFCIQSANAYQIKGVVKDDYNNGVESVVFLESLNGTLPQKADYKGKKKVKIFQKNKQFVPQIAVAQTGQFIKFPNKDNVFHNVFSLTKDHKFDLGLFKGKSGEVKFKKPGVVKIFCNIHSEMFATLVVLNHRHFTKTDVEGNFRLKVPRKKGKYVVHVIDKYGNSKKWTVTLPKKGRLVLKYAQENVDVPEHTKKDGKAYGGEKRTDGDDDYDY